MTTPDATPTPPAGPPRDETCGKCGMPKGHPLHDANRWPGRITTSHPHHGFVPRDQMTVDDLTSYRPATPAPGAPTREREREEARLLHRVADTWLALATCDADMGRAAFAEESGPSQAERDALAEAADDAVCDVIAWCNDHPLAAHPAERRGRRRRG